jgi:hypothetical protein
LKVETGVADVVGVIVETTGVGVEVIVTGAPPLGEVVTMTGGGVTVMTTTGGGGGGGAVVTTTMGGPVDLDVGGGGDGGGEVGEHAVGVTNVEPPVKGL